MANGGTLRGVQVLSPTAWQSLHDQPTLAPIFGTPIQLTQGGLGKFEKRKGIDVEGYYGWMGYGQYSLHLHSAASQLQNNKLRVLMSPGGSIFQWHPQLKVGFAFTCTSKFSQ